MGITFTESFKMGGEIRRSALGFPYHTRPSIQRSLTALTSTQAKNLVTAKPYQLQRLLRELEEGLGSLTIPERKFIRKLPQKVITKLGEIAREVESIRGKTKGTIKEIEPVSANLEKIGKEAEAAMTSLLKKGAEFRKLDEIEEEIGVEGSIAAMEPVTHLYSLDNGLKIIIDQVKGAESVVAGAFVGTGSNNETDSEHGISHLIEHMLFKETDMFTEKQLAEIIEEMGGDLNAHTGHESTFYYLAVPDKYTKHAIVMLSQLLLSSKLKEEHLATEKGVVHEEINMYRDKLNIHQRILTAMSGGHPLAHDIAGTVESVGVITRDMIIDYMERYYTPDNMIISISGEIENPDEVAQLIASLFGRMKGTTNLRPPRHPIKYGSKIDIVHTDRHQINFALGTRAVPQTFDPGILTLSAISFCLSLGMSSRLFDKLRSAGLVYGVKPGIQLYQDGGIFYIYSGTTGKEKLKRAVDIILGEFEDIKTNGISEEELKRAQIALGKSIIAGFRNVSERAEVLADMLFFKYGRDIQKFGNNLANMSLITELSKVMHLTTAQVKRFARIIFQDKYLSMVALGSISEKDPPIKELKLPEIEKIKSGTSENAGPATETEPPQQTEAKPAEQNGKK